MSAASRPVASGRVVTVTANAAIDHTVIVPGFRAGAVNRVESEQRSPGGKGVNVAAALRMLGVEAVATGFLGGGNDELFTEFLGGEGIDDRFLRLPGVTRTGIKIVDGEGITTDLNFPGVAVSAGDVDRLVAVVAKLAGGAAWVALSGSLPPGAPADLYARLTAAAHAGGAAVALDTSGAALAAAVGARPDLVKPNTEELEELVRRPLPDTAAVLGAAAELQAMGIPRIVVSRGVAGGLFVDEDEAVEARPPPVAVVSTVGAGDATVAGTLAALLRGESLTEVARLAMACGATAVETLGPRLDAAAVARRAREVTVAALAADGRADPQTRSRGTA